MKKDKMDVVLFSMISSIIFTGCHTVRSSSEKVKEKEPAVTQMGTEEKEVTNEQIRNFVKYHPDEYGEIFGDLKDSEIHIETKTLQEQTLYFFLYTPQDYWGITMYQIKLKDGEVESLDYVSQGASNYFNFDVISISEGDFITVYSASNMGTGYLQLVNMEHIPERKLNDEPDYELYAVDDHYEDILEQDGTARSSIFDGALLMPEYQDANKDGHTDIMLNGTVMKYQRNKETGEEELTGTDEVHQVYLFDPENKTFTLEQGEDLRERKPLSISDTVINNHELLNDSPCTEYNMLDIYQYHGEPKKIITYKEETGAYRHYLVYEGIVYVVVNEKAVMKKDNMEQTEYIDYVILTSKLYSLSIGIQVGMSEEELSDTGIDFEAIKHGDDLDSVLLSGKTGYLRKMNIPYDTIYYAESSYDENTALAVIVKDGKVTRIATDKLYE